MPGTLLDSIIGQEQRRSNSLLQDIGETVDDSLPTEFDNFLINSTPLDIQRGLANAENPDLLLKRLKILDLRKYEEVIKQGEEVSPIQFIQEDQAIV